MSAAPPIEVAAPYVEAADSRMARRRLPCICPEQHKGAQAATVAYTTTRGCLRERVACLRCPRTWTRVTA